MQEKKMRISFGIECKDWRFYRARRKAQEKGEGTMDGVITCCSLILRS